MRLMTGINHKNVQHNRIEHDSLRSLVEMHGPGGLAEDLVRRLLINAIPIS